jgi:hypothetical protein
MSGSITIVFSYTDDDLVRASLREFQVYAVDDNNERLAGPVIILPDQIPTTSAPLAIPMPPGATQVEVVPVDLDGREGKAAYA